MSEEEPSPQQSSSSYSSSIRYEIKEGIKCLYCGVQRKAFQNSQGVWCLPDGTAVYRFHSQPVADLSAASLNRQVNRLIRELHGQSEKEGRRLMVDANLQQALHVISNVATQSLQVADNANQRMDYGNERMSTLADNTNQRMDHTNSRMSTLADNTTRRMSGVVRGLLSVAPARLPRNLDIALPPNYREEDDEDSTKSAQDEFEGWLVQAYLNVNSQLKPYPFEKQVQDELEEAQSLIRFDCPRGKKQFWKGARRLMVAPVSLETPAAILDQWIYYGKFAGEWELLFAYILYCWKNHFTLFAQILLNQCPNDEYTGLVNSRINRCNHHIKVISSKFPPSMPAPARAIWLQLPVPAGQREFQMTGLPSEREDWLRGFMLTQDDDPDLAAITAWLQYMQIDLMLDPHEQLVSYDRHRTGQLLEIWANHLSNCHPTMQAIARAVSVDAKKLRTFQPPAERPSFASRVVTRMFRRDNRKPPPAQPSPAQYQVDSNMARAWWPSYPQNGGSRAAAATSSQSPQQHLPSMTVNAQVQGLSTRSPSSIAAASPAHSAGSYVGGTSPPFSNQANLLGSPARSPRKTTARAQSPALSADSTHRTPRAATSRAQSPTLSADSTTPHSVSEVPRCAICASVFHQGLKLSCGHRFHTHCLQEHAHSSQLPDRCPICRQETVASALTFQGRYVSRRAPTPSSGPRERREKRSRGDDEGQGDDNKRSRTQQGP